jgi:hypothetical protein
MRGNISHENQVLPAGDKLIGGPDRDRTDDLFHAIS